MDSLLYTCVRAGSEVLSDLVVADLSVVHGPILRVLSSLLHGVNRLKHLLVEHFRFSPLDLNPCCAEILGEAACFWWAFLLIESSLMLD